MINILKPTMFLRYDAVNKQCNNVLLLGGQIGWLG
jgi:hypothetical protein